MAALVAIISGGSKRKKKKGQVRSRRGGAAAAGSLPESTTLNQVNSITNGISQRKSRTRRREDAAGGEERWASDENQTWLQPFTSRVLLPSAIFPQLN